MVAPGCSNLTGVEAIRSCNPRATRVRRRIPSAIRPESVGSWILASITVESMRMRRPRTIFSAVNRAITARFRVATPSAPKRRRPYVNVLGPGSRSATPKWQKRRQWKRSETYWIQTRSATTEDIPNQKCVPACTDRCPHSLDMAIASFPISHRRHDCRPIRR